MQSENKIRKILKYLLNVVLIAGAYYGTGRLGLLLAIPPGYATAVWPPSGVVLAAILCLGYRYWPGVLIGSFCVNMFTSFDPANADSMLLSTAIAAIIACGASAQAVFSASLVRRFISIPNPLEHARDIILLIVIGGPIGCLLNATIGTSTLTLFGALPWNDYGYNWLTWWVGDSIGVIAFTPILLLLFNNDSTVSRNRRLLVSSILFIAFALTIYVFFAASKSEQKNQQVEFERNANEMQQQLTNDLQNYTDALNSIARFYDASDYVEAIEFKIFVKHLLEEYPGIHALAWNQVVKDSERSAFEAEMQKQGVMNYEIKDRLESGKLVTSPHRPLYIPISYAESPGNYKKSMGYDTYSEAQRKIALDMARDSGQPIVTSKVTVVQDDQRLNAVIIYQPIYKGGFSTNSATRILKGYAAGVFVLPEVLKPLITMADHRDLSFVVVDDSVAQKELRNLFSYDSDSSELVIGSKSHVLKWNEKIEFAGHKWILEVYPTENYLVAHTNWTVWIVLCGGLIVTGLFGAFLLLVTGRTDMVQKLVEKRTQDLNESMILNRAILSSAAHMIIIVNKYGTVVVFNSEAEKALGYKSEEVVGIHAPALWHDKQEIKKRMEELGVELGKTIEPGLPVFVEKAIRDGVEEREWTFIRKDGTEFPVTLSVTAIRDAGGAIKGFMGIAKDISLEKTHENERRVSNELLRRSEENFRLSFENATIGEALVSPHGKWLKANKALCDIVGYSEEELIKVDFQTLTHPDDLELDIQQVQQMLRKEIESYQMEKRYFHKNGHIVWVKLSVSLVWQTPDEPLYFISQIQDITELRGYEEQREKLVSGLTESNTELERFAYVASHDMQEPLRMIANFSALIAEDYGSKLDESGIQYLSLVTDGALRMQAMVSDLLEYARVGNDISRFTKINTREELGHVLENLAAAISEREAIITYDKLPEIEGIPVQFMRLLQNLIGNGLKYQGEGVIPKVHIGVQDDVNFWRFSVKDNGIGMENEYVEKIFEPFKRLHTWQQYQGTGIGLAVCKKIVENHGGRIWATSVPGKGSIFYFTIPKVNKDHL